MTETTAPDILAPRRAVLLAPLLAAMPLAFAGPAAASPLNPEQTIIRLPDQIPWKGQEGFPENSVDMAPVIGAVNQPGQYFVFVRWHPGYMSAPHSYVTDRLCVVVSGTWWVNSGDDFDPARTVPVPAGSFVRRVAHTPHYDGVRADGREPVVIAISGIGPVGQKLIEPGPGWRKV